MKFRRFVLPVMAVLTLVAGCASESSEQRSTEPSHLAEQADQHGNTSESSEQRSAESLAAPDVSVAVTIGSGLAFGSQRNLSRVLPSEVVLEIVGLLDSAIQTCDIFGDGVDPLGCAPAVWRVCYSVDSLWESSRPNESSKEAADLAVSGILDDVCDAALVADSGELLGVLALRYREQFFSDTFSRFREFWFQGLAESFAKYRKEFREDGDGSDIVADKLVEFWDAVRNFSNRVWIWNSERLSQEFDLYVTDLPGDERSANDESILGEGDPNMVGQLCDEARRAAREDHQDWEKKIDVCLKSSDACNSDTQQPSKICADLSAAAIREHLWQSILKVCATVENLVPVLTEDSCYNAGIEFCQHEGIPDYFFDTPGYIESYISEYSEWVIHHKICRWVDIQ